MIQIKRALISVSDKTGVVEFAQQLTSLGVEIISTGGTAALLKKSSVDVVQIAAHTGFPEMLDGRVKTLHPKIHGGLLALRESAEHMRQVEEQGIDLIDMVVVNLYPFEKTIQKTSVTLREAIENIDIGGPSMLRSAAKNFRSVAVVCDITDYTAVAKELRDNHGLLSRRTCSRLGQKVFALTASYDKAIYEFLSKDMKPSLVTEDVELFPHTLQLQYRKVYGLRYGENPHQRAALYSDITSLKPTLVKARKLHGKELSFNNYLDLNAALSVVREFEEPAAVVIKHLNPTGVALAKDIKTAYTRAWSADSLSSFGGIVGLNRIVDSATAKKLLASGFLECILAPEFEKSAFTLLQAKKNLRLLTLPVKPASCVLQLKTIDGGILVQESDAVDAPPTMFKVVTKHKPTKRQWGDLLFGWKVVKHVKSNAIVFAKSQQTVGIGMGQVNRVDSVGLAAQRAGKKSRGAVLCSDAFFPHEDNIARAAKAKITAIIQPGGSIADERVIRAANRYGIAMVFTGFRHFNH